MELDHIIESLNKKENISSITSSNLEDAGLTEAEKTFIKTYQPEKVLIVYGTLAPGKPNHKVIAHIKGQWKNGIIRGELVQEGWAAEHGYNAFRHTSRENEKAIESLIFFSDELEASWQMLDEFAGAHYRRLLAKYELETGEIGVGYIYANNESEV